MEEVKIDDIQNIINFVNIHRPHISNKTIK